LHSIRIFLVASILATLVLFNFVAALQGYQSSMEEAEELFDRQLEDLAAIAMKLDVGESHKDISLGSGILFQVWQSSELLVASLGSPTDSLLEFEEGFGFVNFDGYRWRGFAQFNSNSERWVMVAERSDLRFVLAENVVLESVLPILLGIPLVGLLIWSIVSVGLRPLRDLSIELKEKQAHDLSPVNSENSTKELVQIIESTNSFIKRLDEMLKREKQFSADAAHELRTPVSALKIQLHNLGEELGSDHESFLQLRSGVDRMQHLIEQLLALYRTTPEEFAQNCHEINLYQLVQEEIAQFYSTFENKNQIIELNANDIFIEGDEFASHTLVSNLLSNASKYTPEGGKILVSIKEEGLMVVLSVEDSGPGIREEDRERIFDRFYRSNFGDKSNSEETLGCGLGLTIVEHIASLHQANIVVDDSVFETGSAFRVRFSKKK
jgi:two-component system, OmpR family, sensor histidine kinase QseC